MSRTSTRTIVTCGLLIALLALSCLFTIPLGPVPFTLQTAVIILLSLLLTPGQAAATCGIYLLMGAVGLPVFSGMTGGFGKFLGPTGGFLVSYPIASFAMTSIFICLLCMQKVNAVNVIAALAAIVGVIVCKCVGLSGPAILIGAVFGCVCGYLFGSTQLKRERGERA